MAQIQPKIIEGGAGAKVYTWENMASGDTGYPVKLPSFSDKSVHFYGTGGTSPSASLYGSNDENDLYQDPTAGNWIILTDPQANPITKTSVPALEQVLENPLLTAPAVTAGTGTLITVTIVCK